MRCLAGIFLWVFPCSLSAEQEAKPADFFSCVNWKYAHRDNLKGWKNTATLIRKSLTQWGYAVQLTCEENVDSEQLLEFQEKVMSHGSKGLKLVYIGSHQNRSGKIDFPDQTSEFWFKPFSSPTKTSGSPSVLVIDACYADVMPLIRMGQMFPFDHILSASAAHEETYELRMFSRRPVDFQRRYAAEVRWMKEKLGKNWQGEISFTGFIWAMQYLKWPLPPQERQEWTVFLKGMEQDARRFSKERSRYLASTLKLWE